jgi:hypothetical protein
VDGTDMQQLMPMIAEYDIVMNVAYSDTVLPAIHACSQTGVNYCDAASWGDTVHQAIKLRSEAENAGITAVVATGVSPCISNLMGVHAARQLDEVEVLQIGRADVFNFQTGHELTPDQWQKEPEESFSALNEFSSFFMWTFQKLQENKSRIVPDYQNGRWFNKNPMKSGWIALQPDGNPFPSYPYSSMDDMWGSLPQDLSATKPVELAFSPFPPQLDGLVRKLALHVIEGDISAKDAVSEFYKTVGQNPKYWLTAADDFIVPAKMWVTASGQKHGRIACSNCWLTSPMWNVGGYFLTSVALVVATLKIMRGEIRKQGVWEAEKVYEPLSFFDKVETFIPSLKAGEKMIGESFTWME